MSIKIGIVMGGGDCPASALSETRSQMMSSASANPTRSEPESPVRCAGWLATGSPGLRIALGLARGVCMLALLWVAAGEALGAEAISHYRPPRAFAQKWAKTIGFVLVGSSAVLIVYTLAFRRQRLGDTSSKWMLFTGICLLPTPVMFLSTAVGLDQSKNVEFCMSCHVMRPFVDDLKNPGSKTLAALHYQNRYIQREHCYRCHTDYGILGTMEAKKAGLGHVWKATTGSYRLPIQMSKPYNYAICLDCHAESARFNKEAAHDGVVQETAAGKGNCLDCHDAPHPPPATRSKK
jgi:cytochrome c nitrite reductase small subunit